MLNFHLLHIHFLNQAHTGQPKTYNPEKLDQDVSYYQKLFSGEVLNIGLTSTLCLFVFALWVFILAKALRPFRLSKSGIPRDGSLMITGIILILATVCTVLTVIIYQDLRPAFGF